LRHVSLLDQAFFFHGGLHGGARRHARAKRRDVGKAGDVNADIRRGLRAGRAGQSGLQTYSGRRWDFLAVQARRIKDQ